MSDGPIASVDVRTASERSSDGALLVDVRERDEFDVVRVPGAVLLPLSTLADRWQELPRDRALLIYCASGKRSLAAADHLRRQGYADVSNVEGGIIAWRDAGLPVDTGPAAPDEGGLARG